ncbi:MAG: hypothetical protein RLZZ127_2955, partial [Planctomycetota bacterium]
AQEAVRSPARPQARTAAAPLRRTRNEGTPDGVLYHA